MRLVVAPVAARGRPSSADDQVRRGGWLLGATAAVDGVAAAAGQVVRRRQRRLRRQRRVRILVACDRGAAPSSSARDVRDATGIVDALRSCSSFIVLQWWS